MVTDPLLIRMMKIREDFASFIANYDIRHRTEVRFPEPLLIRTKMKPYESITSAIYRMANDNLCPTPSWVWGIVAPKNTQICTGSLGDPDVISALAILNKCHENEIYFATVHSFAHMIYGSNTKYMDKSAVKGVVRQTTPQYCPICMSESNYHRVFWDILFVTLCTKHGIVLQDVCPSCKKQLNISEILKNRCKCGLDLLKVEPISVADIPGVVDNQKFIQSMLGIKGDHEQNTNNKNEKNPVLRLSPPEFFKLLALFRNLMGKLPESSSFLKLGELTASPIGWYGEKKNVSTITNFIFVNSATTILLNWPEKFYEFLDDYGKVVRLRWRASGITKNFEGFGDLFLSKLDKETYGFVHTAFAYYINERWDGGHINGNMKYAGTDGKHIKRYLTVEETSEILHTTEAQVTRLFKEGILTGKVLQANSKSRYLISSDIVYSLRDRVEKLIPLPKLVERWGICSKSIKRMAKHRLIEPFKIRPWGPAYSYNFESQEAERFEKEFFSEEKYKVVRDVPQGYIRFNDAQKSLAFAKVDNTELLKMVCRGKVIPLLLKGERGPCCLLFDKKELEIIRDKILRGADITVKQRSSKEKTTSRMARHIGLSRHSISHVEAQGI